MTSCIQGNIEEWTGGGGVRSIRQRSKRASDLPSRIVPIGKTSYLEQTPSSSAGLPAPSTSTRTPGGGDNSYVDKATTFLPPGCETESNASLPLTPQKGAKK